MSMNVCVFVWRTSSSMFVYRSFFLSFFLIPFPHLLWFFFCWSSLMWLCDLIFLTTQYLSDLHFNSFLLQYLFVSYKWCMNDDVKMVFALRKEKKTNTLGTLSNNMLIYRPVNKILSMSCHVMSYSYLSCIVRLSSLSLLRASWCFPKKKNYHGCMLLFMLPDCWCCFVKCLGKVYFLISVLKFLIGLPLSDPVSSIQPSNFILDDDFRKILQLACAWSTYCWTNNMVDGALYWRTSIFLIT